MKNMREQDIEDILSQLKPRSAPASLRLRVLTGLEKSSRRNVQNQTRFRTRCESFGMATALMVAIGFWVVSGQVQERRLAHLFGPSSAERRSEATLQSFGRIEDRANKEFLREQLTRHFKRLSQTTGPLCPHSLTPKIMSYLESSNQHEASPKVSNRHHGDSSYLRRCDGLEKSSTT